MTSRIIMETSKQLTKAFSGYSLGVIFSRISGMLRDVALAFFFGTSSSIALFMVAYRLSNLFRRLLAETPLSSSFIPHYQSLCDESKEKGALFYRDLALFLILSCTLICLAVCLFSFSILSLIPLKSSTQQILALSLKMFPSLIFLVFYGLSSAHLQCEKVFFTPAVAPLFFNIGWMVFAFFSLFFSPSNQMTIMAFGVVCAFFFQAAITGWRSWTLVRQVLPKELFWKTAPVFKRLKTLAKPFALGTVGVATTQINAALDSLFAHSADPSGPAYLWYAIRIEQVPIALFAISLTTPLLSLLSKAYGSGDINTGKELVDESFKKMYALMTFSFFGLCALSSFGLNLLFARGEFDIYSLLKTNQCLLAYSAGVIPHGLSLTALSVFYANKDFSYPTKVSMITVGIHVLSNLFLVFGCGLGAFSIALSTALSTCFQWFLLKGALIRRYNIRPAKVALKHMTIGFIALIAPIFATAKYYHKLFIKKELLSGFEALIACFIGSVFFVIVYGALEKRFAKGEILNLVRRKFRA